LPPTGTPTIQSAAHIASSLTGCPWHDCEKLFLRLLAGVVEQFAEKPGKGALQELLQGSKYSSETQPFEVIAAVGVIWSRQTFAMHRTTVVVFVQPHPDDTRHPEPCTTTLCTLVHPTSPMCVIRLGVPLTGPPSWLQASMGIYLFRRQVLEELLQDKNPGGTGRQDEHFGYDVIPHALRNGAKVPRACV
jgi:hypothetical protein